MFSLKPNLRIGHFWILDNIVMLQIPYTNTNTQIQMQVKDEEKCETFVWFYFLCF